MVIDKVINQCNTFISSLEGDNYADHYMIRVINNKLDDCAFLTEEVRNNYKQKNVEVVLGPLVTGYKYVRDNLNVVKGKATNSDGLYYYVKDGIRSADTKFVKYNDKYYLLKKGVRASKDTYQKYNGVYLRLSTTKFEYTGKSRKPSVKIYDSKGNKLSTKYYTVSYAYGRKYVGKYKVTVKLKGKYSGTKKLYFKIIPKKTSVSIVGLPLESRISRAWIKEICG